MNRRIGLGLAVVATLLTLYYAMPLFLAIISLGEICPYSPAATGICAQGVSVPTTTGPLTTIPRSLQRDDAKLCKRRGIRYAGETAEGAEVCFTLTPDRSSWLEIGFKFVRASRCSQTTGRSYYEGPEPLAGPARIVAFGFTATIRDGRAAGVLAEPGICGAKRFKWTAHRAP